MTREWHPQDSISRTRQDVGRSLAHPRPARTRSAHSALIRARATPSQIAASSSSMASKGCARILGRSCSRSRPHPSENPDAQTRGRRMQVGSRKRAMGPLDRGAVWWPHATQEHCAIDVEGVMTNDGCKCTNPRRGAWCDASRSGRKICSNVPIAPQALEHALRIVHCASMCESAVLVGGLS